ncbi:MAG: hypothetical protein ACI9FU_000848 [Granulosicoccus sp.]|jgi:hypothetical protein
MRYLFFILIGLFLLTQSTQAQSKYEGDALFSLQGITEGSNAFKELMDSIGPFEIEDFPGGIMKKYVSKTNGVSLTLFKRERVNSPGQTYHLAEMELSLGLTKGYYTGLLPLDIFTIVNQKEQTQILKAKEGVEILKKKSRKGYLAVEYSGYKNARLKGNLKLSMSYIEDQLYMLIISH